MSGVGIGGGAILVLLLGGYYVVMGVLAVLTVGVGAAVKGVQKAFKEGEKKRMEKAVGNLSAVEGEMGRIARQRQLEMQKIAEEADQRMREAAEERNRELTELGNAIQSAGKNSEKAAAALDAFYARQEKSLDESFRRETEALHAAVARGTEKMRSAVTEQVTSMEKQALSKITELEDTLDARQKAYETFARQRSAEVSSMLDALKRTYSCDRLAMAETASVEAYLKTLQEQLAAGRFEEAAGTGVLAAEQVQLLHVTLEQKTIEERQLRLMLDEELARLQALEEATHTLPAEGKQEDLKPFLQAGEADFWAEGRLAPLWRKAEDIRRRAAMEGVSPVTLTLEARTLQREMTRAYGRASELLATRGALIKLAQAMIEAHGEDGWELAEDPVWHGGSVRGDMVLRFKRGDDVRVVVLHNEFDAASGHYEQRIIRYAHEEGAVDEEQRRKDDAAVNASLARLGIPAQMHVTCDLKTAGQKPDTDAI